MIATFFGPSDPRCKCARQCFQSQLVCGAVRAAKEIRPDLEDVIDSEVPPATQQCGAIMNSQKLCCYDVLNKMCTLLEDHLQPVSRYSLDEYYQQLSKKQEDPVDG